jgi:hypothetical protein
MSELSLEANFGNSKKLQASGLCPENRTAAVAKLRSPPTCLRTAFEGYENGGVAVGD